MIDSAQRVGDAAPSSAEVPPEAATVQASPRPEPQLLPLRFTGTGGEYFRIWVVNLLLTVLTLGVYSAWAKVRKTRYFWSNTQLDGAAFQYHGNPGAILRGRILVGALLAAYSLAGRISLTAGAVAALVLGLLAPWLFVKAMRFKLSNTSWRGVRFGFDSTVGASYAALGGAVALWVLMSAALAAGPAAPGGEPNFVPLLAVYALAFAFAPLLHARIKRYQHGAITCGSLRFEMGPAARAFYGVYAKALVATIPAGVIVVIGAMGMAAFSTRGRPPGESADTMSMFLAIAGLTYVLFLVLYAGALAYFTARLQQVIWSRTYGGPVRFSTAISAGSLLEVWLKNGIFTVLSLGLYWPFAAVNIARYRIECMTVEASAPLGTIAAGALGVERSAAGDGAVDLLGWDVGL